MQVAEDECRHFQLLEKRLEQTGSHYGALPAHDGLWESARETGQCRAGQWVFRVARAGPAAGLAGGLLATCQRECKRVSKVMQMVW